jgi:hypothetical protein
VLYSDRKEATPRLPRETLMIIGWIMLIVLWIAIVGFVLGAVVFMFRSAGR